MCVGVCVYVCVCVYACMYMTICLKIRVFIHQVWSVKYCGNKTALYHRLICLVVSAMNCISLAEW